jgi:ABC-2 type transport system ATP-binding protein
MTTGALLAAERITVRFGRRIALSEVSLAVEPGAFYALLGRNGAGKSSLVRCLLGEQRPDEGRALLLGLDAWRHRHRALREVGVVPEESHAPPQATANQLARFCSRLYPRWDGAGCARRLAQFGIPAEVPFGQLSKGERGQVALTLALACLPRLLVLDDPTLGLDPVARRALFAELIDELADRGTTVFLATHELAAVEGIASQVAILDHGHLVIDESLERLKGRFRRIHQRRPEQSRPRLVVAGGESAARTSAASCDLTPLAPLSSVVSAWGTETVVTAFDSERFAQLSDGGTAESAPLTLEEIFLAVVGSGAPR